MKKVLNLPPSYEQTGFQDERFTKVRVKSNAQWIEFEQFKLFR